MGSLLGAVKGHTPFLSQFHKLEADYQDAADRLHNDCPLWRKVLFNVGLCLKKPYLNWKGSHYSEYHISWEEYKASRQKVGTWYES